MFLKEIRNIFVSRTQHCCVSGQTEKHLCLKHCVLVCHQPLKSIMFVKKRPGRNIYEFTLTQYKISEIAENALAMAAMNIIVAAGCDIIEASSRSQMRTNK